MILTVRNYSPMGLKRSFSDSEAQEPVKKLSRRFSDAGVYPEETRQPTIKKIKKVVRFCNDHPGLAKPVPTEMLKYQKQLIFYNHGNTRVFMGGEAPSDLWVGRVKTNSKINLPSSTFDLNEAVKMVLGDLNQIMAEQGEPSDLVRKYIQAKVDDGSLSLVIDEEIDEVKKVICSRLKPNMTEEQKDDLIDNVMADYENDKIKDVVERVMVSISLGFAG